MLSLDELERVTREKVIDPTVRIIYGQAKAVLDEIVAEHGRPARVHVEIAREIGRGIKAAARKASILPSTSEKSQTESRRRESYQSSATRDSNFRQRVFYLRRR